MRGRRRCHAIIAVAVLAAASDAERPLPVDVATWMTEHAVCDAIGIPAERGPLLTSTLDCFKNENDLEYLCESWLACDATFAGYCTRCSAGLQIVSRNCSESGEQVAGDISHYDDKKCNKRQKWTCNKDDFTLMRQVMKSCSYFNTRGENCAFWQVNSCYELLAKSRSLLDCPGVPQDLGEAAKTLAETMKGASPTCTSRDSVDASDAIVFFVDFVVPVDTNHSDNGRDGNTKWTVSMSQNAPDASLVAAVVIITVFMMGLILLSIRKTLNECFEKVATSTRQIKQRRNPYRRIQMGDGDSDDEVHASDFVVVDHGSYTDGEDIGRNIPLESMY